MQSTGFEARAEAIHPGLRPLALRPNRAGHMGYLHLVLIEKGSGLVSGGQIDLRLTDNMVLILPPDPTRVLTIQAGSRGWLIGAAPDVVAEALGARADAQALRALTARIGLITGNPDLSDLIGHAAAFHRELDLAARGAAMAALAHLRLILIGVWRHSAEDMPALRGQTPESRFVEEFRRRVELGFRQQRPVSAYAEDLGLTYDRLHDICRRNLKRTPLQLIHQRMLREAALRLERSGETIEQIALSLGFADPTRFSHFFRRHAGTSPREFRRAAASRPGFDQASFADWP
ncbi:helix-turn-helix domain-containing protein [bacterium]|nr:helix-turn-helix domain-containing protein [bacterium]